MKTTLPLMQLIFRLTRHAIASCKDERRTRFWSERQNDNMNMPLSRSPVQTNSIPPLPSSFAQWPCFQSLLCLPAGLKSLGLMWSLGLRQPWRKTATTWSMRNALFWRMNHVTANTLHADGLYCMFCLQSIVQWDGVSEIRDSYSVNSVPSVHVTANQYQYTTDPHC